MIISTVNKNINNAFSLDDCLNYADETKALLIKRGALEEIPVLLHKHYVFDAVCLIADENTFRAAGQRVKAILEKEAIKISGSYIFSGGRLLHADYDHVLSLKDWIQSLPDFPSLVPVVTGAGTLNDLVKRASFELELPYFCVPTAASVDGFTPNGAALLVDGFKQTMPCTAPKVLAADTDVISGAPAYLSSSGFGDLAGKIIAGTDWIIAEIAGSLGAPEAPAIDPISWGMVQNNLRQALENSVNAARGDGEAVNSLFEALAVTGFSMQYMKSSRPVSGSEHLWSHLWEMEDLLHNGVPVTHGHKVTIGTLAASAFTEIFFRSIEGPPEVPKAYSRPSRDERKAEVSGAFKTSRAHDKVVSSSMAKMMDEKTVNKINQAFRDSWKEIRAGVLERLLPYNELKALLSKAGCPVLPKDIGLGRNSVIAASRKAQMIRNKYGILDLAWDMGNFNTVLEEIENSKLYLR